MKRKEDMREAVLSTPGGKEDLQINDMHDMDSLQKGDKNSFIDILEERRTKSDIIWASRDWNAAVAYSLIEKNDPLKIKSLVLNSYRLQKILLKINQEKQVPLKELYNEVDKILNEISYNRKIPVLRWLGFFVAKILKKLLNAVYVNEAKFLQIKSQMGNNPLLFVPSHKSYCDFILMSYICFHYEVDIPRIAAGMDFQSMAFMGNVLRDACAFFMRRSFIDDELYSAVFSQYVHTLVVYGDAPIEFFIEGTRSRTQKSLMPKYGFLSMTLKPFLIGLVPDITIIPVNLSYDRVLEEVLFAYELLGVPKPKESTRGFFKALSILNENYGNIYVQFGEPISVKKYLRDKADRSDHGFGSVEMQEITQQESKCIISLAHSVVCRQKELTLLNCFNLIATVLNNFIMRQSEPLHLDTLFSEVQWLFEVFKFVAPKNLSIESAITEDIILHHIDLHKSLIHLSPSKTVQLSRIHSNNPASNAKKLKGYELSNCTMDIAIPSLILQYYVNPCANFLIGVCFIALIIESLPDTNLILKDELFKKFEFLCSIFSHEFVLYSDFINEDFSAAFNHSRHFKIIHEASENKLEKGNNIKLTLFCVNFLQSFIPGYITMIKVLTEFSGAVVTENQLLKESQRKLESKLNNGSTIHPANLSLDLLTNALQSLLSMKAVIKKKGINGSEYQANQEKLKNIHSKLSVFDFSAQNSVNVGQHLSAFIKTHL